MEKLASGAVALVPDSNCLEIIFDRPNYFEEKCDRKSLARIFDIPQYVFHIIFGEYLTFRDILKFDDAVCNYLDRIIYLYCLKDTILKNQTPTYPLLNRHVLFWIHKRRVGLQKIQMTPATNHNLIETFCPWIWPHITTLIINDFPPIGPPEDVDVLVGRLLKCTSLEHLTFILDGDPKTAYLKSTYSVEKFMLVFENERFCSQLRHLHLKSTRSISLTERAGESIAKYCIHLQYINFESIQLSDSNMTQLLMNCGSNIVRFHYNFRFDNLLRYCPKLTMLPRTVYFNNELIAAGQHCPNLVNLLIGRIMTPVNNSFGDADTRVCNDTGALAVFQGCRKLVNIKIAHCQISDIGVTRAAECCNLRVVILSDLPNITLKSLVSLSKNCPELDELKLTNLDFSAVDLNELSEQCIFPQLIHFSSTEVNVGDSFVLALAKNSPRLMMFSLHSMPNITDVGMHHIATHCRNLTNLWLFNLAGFTRPDNLVNILINNPRLGKGFKVNSSTAPLIYAEAQDNNQTTYSFSNQKKYTAKIQEILDSRRT